MTLANLLITHGTELVTAEGPDDVQKLNDLAVAHAREFIARIEPPQPDTPKPKPDLSNVKEYRSA